MLNPPNKPPVTLEKEKKTKNTLKLENTLNGTHIQTDSQTFFYCTFGQKKS